MMVFVFCTFEGFGIEVGFILVESHRPQGVVWGLRSVVWGLSKIWIWGLKPWRRIQHAVDEKQAVSTEVFARSRSTSTSFSLFNPKP